jgi:hypothetical protein
MPRLFPLHCAVVILTMAAPVAANDVAEACREFATAEVIFVGRVKSAPITRRISNEEAVEKARVVMEAAERDFKAYEALKMPPEIVGGQLRDLAIRMILAREAFDMARVSHPPPFDVSLTPMIVETAFRGVTTPELFLMNKGQHELDPGRSYLFYATRRAGPLAPDVITAERTKDVESAEADLQFLHEAVANNPGTVVSGSLMLENLNDTRSSPLGGVVLRVSLDGQRYETSTRADGTFLITGVPPGMLMLEPVLPDHLTLPPQRRRVLGGCMTVHMRARVTGRIRGRVLLENGAGFRGVVDLVPEDPSHQSVIPSPAFTNERGEFEFSASPGTYLLGVNIVRPPTAGAPFRPTYFPGTTDLSQAARVVIGTGTEQAEIEWVVNSRLGEGSIDVAFDTHGQPQKEMSVCVTMFNADFRNNGGTGYEGRSNEFVTVPVVEGVRYRLVAHARVPSGFAESEIFDVIGAPGRQAVRLAVASVSETNLGVGALCPSAHSTQPFSPSR